MVFGNKVKFHMLFGGFVSFTIFVIFLKQHPNVILSATQAIKALVWRKMQNTLRTKRNINFFIMIFLKIYWFPVKRKRTNMSISFRCIEFFLS